MVLLLDILFKMDLYIPTQEDRDTCFGIWIQSTTITSSNPETIAICGQALCGEVKVGDSVSTLSMDLNNANNASTSS